MKKLISLALIILLLWGCKSKKTDFPVSEAEGAKTKTMMTIHDNTALDLKIDDIGSLYYELVPNETSMVVSYRYEENMPKDIMDGHYIEEIYFQISKPIVPSTLSNTLLTNHKALFDRQCFCRGEAGTSLIMKGNLSIEEHKNNFTFNFDFTVSRGKQVTQKIQGVIPKK
jgi:hypothetical protein